MTLSRYTPLKATKGLNPGVSTLARTGITRTPKDRQAGKPLERATAMRQHKPGSKSTRVPTKIRADVLERDENHCQRCGRDITLIPHSLQHRQPRGAGGSEIRHTMANLVLLCGSATTLCHGEVESYRTQAMEDGFLCPRGISPELWRVRRFLRSWEQPGTTWTPAQPHPEQMRREAA